MPTVVKSVNLDSEETIFFRRQLESIKTKVYKKLYPELKAKRLIPVSHDVDPGASSHTYRMYDQVGMAKIIANYANDLPAVDVKGKEVTAKIRGLGDSYGYSIQDIRAARFANVPLESMKAMAARNAIEQLMDDLAWNGDDDHGLQGFLNHPNIPAGDVADGAGAADTTWATKTPDEIVADVNALINEIKTNTKGVEAANTVLLPVTQYALIATTPRTTTTDTTILEFLQKAHPGVTFEELAKLEGAGVDGSDRMAAYNRSEEKVVMEVPQEFEAFNPQERDLNFNIPCHARFGGVSVMYPLSANFKDGI